MRNNFFYLLTVLALTAVLMSSCDKDETTPSKVVYGCTDKIATNYDPNATEMGGAICTYTGRVTFWYDSFGSDATVKINNQVAKVTGYYPSTVPSCGAQYCANFILPTGTYPYSASSTFSSWTGTAVVTKSGCLTVLLGD